jgi:hypothetical protein
MMEYWLDATRNPRCSTPILQHFIHEFSDTVPPDFLNPGYQIAV